MTMQNHAYNLDIGAIADSLRDAALAAEQMALALRENSSVGLKFAAAAVAKHAARIVATSNSVESRVAARLSRHPHV